MINDKIGREVAVGVKCDVTSDEEVKQAANQARIKFGEVTLLINNAGIVFNKNITEMTTKEAMLTYKVNSIALGITV